MTCNQCADSCSMPLSSSRLEKQPSALAAARDKAASHFGLCISPAGQLATRIEEVDRDKLCVRA